MPTFGGALSAADSERFIQFLTAPYLRIPLVLDFFANGDPGRLSSLKCKPLQTIVDAVLFEPGGWRPADCTHQVSQIPTIDTKVLNILLSTAKGALFNEIAKSPDVLTSCIVKILDRALEMDVGKYSSSHSSGPLILYAIRLAVRVEGYMKLAVNICSKGYRPRGMETLDLRKVASSVNQLRTTLDKKAFPILEYWVEKAVSKNEGTNVICLIHTHLLYLFKNCTYSEFDFKSVSVLLSSQVYLLINHRFSRKTYDDLMDTGKPTDPPSNIQLAQSEVFDLIQRHRYNVLKWLRANPDAGDDVFEAVVRVATGIGTRSQSMEKSTGKRHWRSIKHPTCYGRFIPDTEDAKLRDGSYRLSKPGQTYEEWMLEVTTRAIGTEVNVQLSEFTIQNHKMMPLEEAILDSPDFIVAMRDSPALRESNTVSCAEVLHTSNRLWWRLVGRRHDVQSWAPDKRNYRDFKESVKQNHKRIFPKQLFAGENWICVILQDKVELLLPGVELKMESHDQSRRPYAVLSGWIENPSSTTLSHTLKEVVVWQHPPVINIYNVKEYGRRHFRILEYTSNMSLCLHEVGGDPYPDRVAGILALSAGIPMSTVNPEVSVIISRALNNDLGNQVFIPKRFLSGLVPSALLEKYSFWQGDNDNLSGYEAEPKKGLESSTGPATQLRILLSKSSSMDLSGFCNSEASALIQRIPVKNYEPSSPRDVTRPIHTLLNILAAPPGSILKIVGMLLSRLDNLSHVLAWTKSSIKSINDPCEIDLIELPRVNLTFKSAKIDHIDGSIEYRLYSNDHDGLYISLSTEARQVAEKLLGNIAHFIVLRNEDNDLFVLLPGCALPRRLHVDGNHLSLQILLDRRNQEWIDNMSDIKCYLYPIHTSRAFLFTPSLASSMYLMLLYFITGSYGDVFKMIESCVSEQLSEEEVSFLNCNRLK